MQSVKPGCAKETGRKLPQSVAADKLQVLQLGRRKVWELLKLLALQVELFKQRKAGGQICKVPDIAILKDQRMQAGERCWEGRQPVECSLFCADVVITIPST